MVCGEKLNYRSTSEPLKCYFCEEIKEGFISCVNNHFVCDACHGKDAYGAIIDIAKTTKSSDPIEIAEQMMTHPSVPMIGGEHHVVVASSIIAALKNYGKVYYKHQEIDINDHLIERAIDRTWTDRLPSCMCANYGACGAALAAGAVISLLTGATCDVPKAAERQLAMEATNYAASKILSFRGTCCKLSTRLAIHTVGLILKNYFDVNLEMSYKKCSHMKRNPYKCFGAACPYSKNLD